MQPEIPSNAQIHPAARIARVAGISRQAVSTGLERIEPAGKVTICGQDRDGWRFDSLPLDWQMEMTRRGVKRGFENGAEFLDKMSEPWKCPLPWSEVSKPHQDKAVKLQKAMARALAMLSEPSAAASAVELAGVEDFQAEFGYEISPRHWRRLLHRTLERDGAEENWQQLEIYLDERAFATSSEKPEVLRNEYRHRALDEVFSAMENRADPTSEDRAMLWDAAFRHYEEQTESLTDSPKGNRERKLFKNSLLSYLLKAFPATTLCASAASLRRRFDEKLSAWRDGGRNPQVLADSRHDESGRAGRKLCEKCRPLVVGGAVDLDGALSQAWRQLQLSRQLCPACANIGSFDVRRAKSEVPKSVRRDVEADILTRLGHRHGPRYARQNSPYNHRDWSDIGPGDWAECDDMTPNQAAHGAVEMFAWDDDKEGRHYVGRMEVLFQIDRRTDYPWAYLIVMGDPATPFAPQRKASYSSVHCRLLFLRAHDALGIPHEGGGYWLENGIWKSRLIDGPRVQHWGSKSWQSVEMGLRDPRIGLRVRHTEPGNPRSKVIERVFLAIQNRMRQHPGFLGFNERLDKREVASDFLNRVKLGKEHPGEAVPSVAEFRKLLDAELMAYAHEPQNGVRLPGVSPIEAFHNGISGKPGIKAKPLRQLFDDARFLLSTHERLVRVTGQGIKIKVGGSELVFWGKELEPFQHTEILARFNLEEPELLTCQGPNGKPFTVKARILPSSTATKEQLAETARARASWIKRGKVLFDSLPHPFRANVTHEGDQSEATREAGRFHNEEMEKFRAQKSQKARAREKIRQAGFDPSRLHVKNPERVLTGAQRMKEYRERLARKEQAAQVASASLDDSANSRAKTYHLDPDKVFTPRAKAQPEQEPK